jgi:uncharacterized membrane protein YfcA
MTADLAPLALAALAFVTAGIGAMGGIGGAVLLVPVLVLLGVDPVVAAPLGLLTVASGSLAAAPRQLDAGLVHQRLGVLLEVTASVGALLGALIADEVPETVLAVALALVAIAAGLANLRNRGLRNQPRGSFVAEEPGEWPGTLGGAYRLAEDEVVPYRAQRVRAGLAGMTFAGFVTGVAGVGGGWIKTPLLSEVMHVPVRVAAATSTFTVGITSATALLVFAGQGRLDAEGGAAVVAGALLGGLVGARLQGHLHPVKARRIIGVLLVIIGVVLLVVR